MGETLVMGAAIINAGRVLAARRRSPADLAGGWEFPGGKVEPGEDADAAVIREVLEELGCEIAVTRHLVGTQLIRPGCRLEVAVGSLEAGEPAPDEHDMVRWLAPEELDAVRWLAPDVPFLSELRELLLDGLRLEGGSVGGAVRIGRTVRRATGPWTAAVHDLLDFAAQHGVPHIPRVLGRDVRGREVLTFLPGHVVDVDAELLTEQQIRSVTRWMRNLHEVLRDYSYPGPWRMSPGSSRPEEIICHNDVAPYNICFSGDSLAGVFDWDMAGPNTPLIDLGFLAWNAVPLWRDLAPAIAARRLEVIAAAYAGPPADQILHATVVRVEQLIAGIAAGQAAGDEGMSNLASVGEPGRTQHALAALVMRIPSILDSLRNRRGLLHDKDDALALAVRLRDKGFTADVTRARFAGEDDDEDQPWAVLTDASTTMLERLLSEHDGWLDPGYDAEPTDVPLFPLELPTEPKRIKSHFLRD